MALKLTEKERKRLYYLEHIEEINKKSREYYATKVKPKRQKKGSLTAGVSRSLRCLIYWSRK